MTDDSPASYGFDDVEIVEKRTAYQGYFRIDSYQLRHRTFAGGWSAAATREIFERGHVVVALPYDPVRDAVVLIEQFRPGAYAARAESAWFAADHSPWLVECVAGIIEDGETLEDVARREIREEAGLEALDLKVARRYLVSPGGATESVVLYMARVDSTQAGGVHGLGEEGEDIRVFALPADTAFDWVEREKVLNAAAIMALDWLRLHRDALRQEWSEKP